MKDLHFLVPRATHNACIIANMAFHLLRKRRAQSSQKIAALCIIVACLDEEGEDTRKKGPDRHWLRRRAERNTRKHYRLMSERHWKLVNIVFVVAKLGNICFRRKICVRETKMFLTSGKNIFLFPSCKICCRNICFRRG